MSDPIKFSPLCHRDDGEVFFTAKVDARKLRIRFPNAFLAQACGDAATGVERDGWVKDQKPHLAASLVSSNDLPMHLNGVCIEEIT